ncbi:MAG TPA: NAD(P)H-dependent glycerol-3-phosphate dehydrogenase [Planctomycetaceae bacterium]|nr:NAD(P)H-dependent glycerol-3-phosphate dehydrogenase [Planctomycetaceae bacterium]
MPPKVTVLGSGAMGTACAILLAEHPGQPVALWSRDAEYAREMSATRDNRKLLPGIQIPSVVEITADIERAVAGAELLVVAIPTAFLRAALTSLSPYLQTATPIVSVIKGLENETFLRPSEIVGEVLGTRPVVALGGPSHAEEISRRLPTSVVAASSDLNLARQVQELFSTDRFRVYTNVDIIGVELAGALKNVVAIAAGICDGLGFGDNAKAGLMTRGVVEMTRFGVTLGAEAVTFSGLAGIGDLITTCISPYGRNRRVGERLGRGETLAGILASMEAVAEGVLTSRSVHEYAEELQIEMPIAEEVYRVLFAGKSPLDATSDLMLRPRRRE